MAKELRAWEAGCRLAAKLVADDAEPVGQFSALSRARARKLEVERGALAFLGLEPDAPTHPLDQLAADIEPEPGSADALRHVRIQAVELLEDPGLVVVGNPHSFVDDPEHDRPVSRLQAELDPTAARRVLHGVVDEVHEDLASPVLVGGDRRHVVRSLDVEADVRRRVRSRRLDYSLEQIDGVEWLGLEIEPAELELVR